MQRLLVTNYTTNPVRSASVTKFCAYLSSRANLVTSDQSSTASQYNNQMAQTFSLDGYSFILFLRVTLFNTLTSSVSSGITQIRTQQTALGVFIGFFAVGLVMLLVVWPFLWCCCCCPSCCPSKCCQKN
jgi:uncharacterized membrane protein